MDISALNSLSKTLSNIEIYQPKLPDYEDTVCGKMDRLNSTQESQLNELLKKECQLLFNAKYTNADTKLNKTLPSILGMPYFISISAFSYFSKFFYSINIITYQTIFFYPHYL